ncbi:MAG: cell wall-binding repeat-containing protein [Solirubrobacteraceae bacterium]
MQPAKSSMLLAALALLIAGCGKSAVSGSGSQQSPTGTGQSAETSTLLGTSGAGGIVTANTTRLGGATAVLDAAAVARAVYPGLTPATRPRAVVIVEAGDWPAALAASALAAAPLNAPILYAEGGQLPAVSAAALEAMHPLGSPALGGAQVIAVGTSAPAGYRALILHGSTSYVLGGRIAALVQRLHAGHTAAAIIASASAPAALSMPAAGLAAESGAPILLVDSAGVPRATAAALARLGHPANYAIGPESAIGEATISFLQRTGEATRIGAAGPIENAIKVAAFTNGHFGWGVDEPGHGLVFARTARPLDAPATALLAATGDYAPLLLLSSQQGIPRALARYLEDIEPSYGHTPESQPVRGVYNRGWLIGDQQAISLQTQSQLDALLRGVTRSTPTPQPSLVP